MSADPITIINFVLSFAILILGLAVYARRKDQLALYIGIAFGLFVFSHLTNLLDIAASITDLLIIIRAIAYLIVIFALLKRWNP